MDSAKKKRREIPLLRTFIHIKSLKFSYGLSAQPRAVKFLWRKLWAFFLAEDFLGEISKLLTSKDLGFQWQLAFPLSYYIYDTCSEAKNGPHTILKYRGKRQINTRVERISLI